MKRGRDISHLHISVDVFGKVKLKKYTWICEWCGTEYISRDDAKVCESYHEAVELLGDETDELALLWYDLRRRAIETRRLLGEG